MKTMLRKFLGLNTAVMSAISLLLAIVVSAVIMLICSYNPLEAFGAIFEGAFGSLRAICLTLVQATPIIFTGLAYTFAKKANIINLGVEGQLLMGALAAAVVGRLDLGLPAVLHIPLSLLAGVAAGALCGALVGFLKVRFGSNEVIVSMMLNSILLYFASFLVTGPLMASEGTMAQTERILETAQLPRIFPQYQLTLAFFLAVIACVCIKLFLDRSVLGYEIRCCGYNRLAGETAGIEAGKVILLTLLISGAIGGLAGATHVMGVNRRYIDNFSPGYGFNGIAVSALAAESPIGVIFAGVIFGALTAGSAVLNRTTSIPTDFVDVIQSMVVIFVAAPLLVRDMLGMNRKGRKLDANHH